jgi:chaperonin GroEL (HSP60 family)
MSATIQVPLVLLKEGTSETKGNPTQRNDITAAKAIAEIVRTFPGACGMDKMLVGTVGDVNIANDGATILKEIDLQRPATKMMVEISKATDNEVGDGTTSAVVLAGSLLEKAEELVTKNVHPTVVVEGSSKASQKAVETLREAAMKVNAMGTTFLNKIARSSIASKMISFDSKEPAEIVVNSALAIGGGSAYDYEVDIDNTKVDKKAGGAMRETRYIRRIVLDNEVVHAGMPKRIESAKIALVNSALEIEKTEMSAEIRISDPHQMQMFLEEENRMLKAMVDKIKGSGANVLLCQKGIDDIAQHYLAKAGILAVRRVKESERERKQKC